MENKIKKFFGEYFWTIGLTLIATGIVLWKPEPLPVIIAGIIILILGTSMKFGK